MFMFKYIPLTNVMFSLCWFAFHVQKQIFTRYKPTCYFRGHTVIWRNVWPILTALVGAHRKAVYYICGYLWIHIFYLSYWKVSRASALPALMVLQSVHICGQYKGLALRSKSLCETIRNTPLTAIFWALHPLIWCYHISFHLSVAKKLCIEGQPIISYLFSVMSRGCPCTSCELCSRSLGMPWSGINLFCVLGCCVGTNVASTLFNVIPSIYVWAFLFCFALRLWVQIPAATACLLSKALNFESKCHKDNLCLAWAWTCTWSSGVPAAFSGMLGELWSACCLLGLLPVWSF